MLWFSTLRWSVSHAGGELIVADCVLLMLRMLCRKACDTSIEKLRSPSAVNSVDIVLS
jgi:hypothetical protein